MAPTSPAWPLQVCCVKTGAGGAGGPGPRPLCSKSVTPTTQRFALICLQAGGAGTGLDDNLVSDHVCSTLHFRNVARDSAGRRRWRPWTTVLSFTNIDQYFALAACSTSSLLPAGRRRWRPWTTTRCASTSASRARCAGPSTRSRPPTTSPPCSGCVRCDASGFRTCTLLCHRAAGEALRLHEL